MPGTREAGLLVEKLATDVPRTEENEQDRSGRFKVGPHDDLVRALGLTVE